MIEAAVANEKIFFTLRLSFLSSLITNKIFINMHIYIIYADRNTHKQRQKLVTKQNIATRELNETRFLKIS